MDSLRSGVSGVVIALAVVVMVVIAGVFAYGFVSGLAKSTTSGSTSQTSGIQTSSLGSQSSSNTSTTSSTSSPKSTSIPIAVDGIYSLRVNQTFYATGINFTLTNTLGSVLNISSNISSSNLVMTATTSTGSFPLKGYCDPACVPSIINSTFVLQDLYTGDYLLPGHSGSFFSSFLAMGQPKLTGLNVSVGINCQYIGSCTGLAMALTSSFPASVIEITAANSSQYSQPSNLNSEYGVSVTVLPTFPSAINNDLQEWFTGNYGSDLCGSAAPVYSGDCLFLAGQVLSYTLQVDSPGSYPSNSAQDCSPGTPPCVPRYVLTVESATSTFIFPLQTGPSPFPLPAIPSAALIAGTDWYACLGYNYTASSTAAGSLSQPLQGPSFDVQLQTGAATTTYSGNGYSGTNWAINQSCY